MSKVYLCRQAVEPPSRPACAHASNRSALSSFNRERRVQGRDDESHLSCLTYDGIEQAAALGTYVAGRQARADRRRPRLFCPPDGGSAVGDGPRIDLAFCSPMNRCRQTYAAVAGCCGPSLPRPTIVDELRELDAKEWGGRLRADIIKDDPENWHDFRHDVRNFRLDGGAFAPVLDCWDRALRCWDAIRSDAKDEEAGAVFVMCHGGIGKMMVMQALGLGVDDYMSRDDLAFANAGAFAVEWKDGEDVATRWRRVHPEETGWESV